MKGKILFINPTKSLISPGSGEVEARCLLYGCQLTGYKVDVLSIESTRLDEYCLFFVFACDLESIKFIERLPSNSKVLIISYTDEPESLPVADLKSFSSKQIYFYSRSKFEYERLVNLFGNELVINGRQWFLTPTVYFDEYSPSVIVEESEPFILLMAEPSRSRGIGSLLKSKSFVKVYSDQEYSGWVNYYPGSGDNNKLIFNRRLPYGSAGWYSTLHDSECLFEPNYRITASLLEKLYLGGKVLLDKANPVVQELKPLVKERVHTSDLIEIVLNRPEGLMHYHADFVARDILSITLS